VIYFFNAISNVIVGGKWGTGNSQWGIFESEFGGEVRN